MLLADTTFLIDTLLKKPNVKRFLKENPSEILFTTEINVFEIFLGINSSQILANDPTLYEKRKIRIEQLLSKFQVLHFSRKEAIESSRVLGLLIRKGNMLEFRDGLIAGIALSNGINKIITRN